MRPPRVAMMDWITGEFAGGDGPSYAQLGSVAHYLLGKNALERERLWNDIKRAMRKVDRMGMGPLDIAHPRRPRQARGALQP